MLSFNIRKMVINTYTNLFKPLKIKTLPYNFSKSTGSEFVFVYMI